MDTEIQPRTIIPAGILILALKYRITKVRKLSNSLLSPTFVQLDLKWTIYARGIYPPKARDENEKGRNELA